MAAGVATASSCLQSVVGRQSAAAPAGKLRSMLDLLSTLYARLAFYALCSTCFLRSMLDLLSMLYARLSFCGQVNHLSI